MDPLKRPSVPDGAHWAGRRVFITGHTGFVGGWLALWLQRLGAEVAGYALPAEHARGIFRAARVADGLARHHEADILEPASLQAALRSFDPQVVFHLAAQPLVLEARRDPVRTFAVNALGTVNVLQACVGLPALQQVVAYTTDKVYRNDNSGTAFTEDAPLGGAEPYSSSKVCSEVAIECYADGYFKEGPAVSVVRAGNIIGGGDFCAERLVPDIVRAWQGGTDLVMRRPNAVRPWQHVLDAVRGTLVLAERGRPGALAKWNLGPATRRPLPVIELAGRLLERMGGTARAVAAPSDAYEAQLLSIDASRAQRELGWRTVWPDERMLDLTADWYKAAAGADDMRAFSLRHIDMNAADAARA